MKPTAKHIVTKQKHATMKRSAMSWNVAVAVAFLLLLVSGTATGQQKQQQKQQQKPQPKQPPKAKGVKTIDGGAYFRADLQAKKTNLLWNAADLALEEVVTGEPPVNPVCKKQVTTFNENLKQGEQWAKSVFACQGVPGSAYSTAIGDRRSCLRVKYKIDGTLTGFSYCLLHWKSPQYSPLGVCVPTACNSSDVNKIVAASFPSMTVRAVTCTGERTARTGGKGWRGRDVLGLVVALTLATLLFLASAPLSLLKLCGAVSNLCPLSTLRRCLACIPLRWGSNCCTRGGGVRSDTTDKVAVDANQNENKERGSFLQCFSLQENLAYLMSPEQGVALYPYLHAFRVISMTMVTYLHTIYREPVIIGNQVDLLAFYQTRLGKVSTQIGIMVDVFFVVGGFLSVQSLMRLCSADKSVRFLRLLIRVMWKRYCRLAPVYLAVLLINVSLVPYLTPSNVISPNPAPDACARHPWPHISLTFNLMLVFYGWPVGKCIPNTWYISADFQFHIITFIIVYISVNDITSPRQAFSPFWPAACYLQKKRFLFATSILTSLAAFGIYRFRHPIYTPWTTYAFAEHVPVYLMGGYLGLMYMDAQPVANRSIRKSRIARIMHSSAAQLVTTAACLYVSFLTAYIDLPHKLNMMHMVVKRVFFALGVCCLINVCHRSKGSLLWSHPLWLPLSRLNYSMYVISFTVQEIYVHTSPFPILWRPVDVFFHTCAYLCFTLPCAVFIYLVVDRPTQRLFR